MMVPAEANGKLQPIRQDGNRRRPHAEVKGSKACRSASTFGKRLAG
jgi:hypothetical protein